MGAKAAVEETVFRNVRFFSIAKSQEGTGLWGLVDGDMAFLLKLGQAAKNNRPEANVFMKFANGKLKHFNKVTSKQADFLREESTEVVLEEPEE